MNTSSSHLHLRLEIFQKASFKKLIYGGQLSKIRDHPLNNITCRDPPTKWTCVYPGLKVNHCHIFLVKIKGTKVFCVFNWTKGSSEVNFIEVSCVKVEKKQLFPPA